jgi:mannan polymerase complexes MNN9 subunit
MQPCRRCVDTFLRSGQSEAYLSPDCPHQHQTDIVDDASVSRGFDDPPPSYSYAAAHPVATRGREPSFSKTAGAEYKDKMAMHPPRALRRTNPITLVLVAILTIGFLYFIFSDPSTSSASLPKGVKQAANALSPPSLPFKKPKKGVPSTPPPVVFYDMNNLTTTTDPIINRESVLILTPLARFYQEYWDNLLKLNYPHELISLGFVIPKGREGNAATAALQEQIKKTQSGSTKKRFASVTILRQDTESPLHSQSESERHKMENQKARRAAMSKARNSLLFTTMGPTTSWVFWLDSDIVETPSSIIQDLAAHDKPIIVPNCFQRFYNKDKGTPDVRPYDYNSWIDSPTAQSMAQQMGKDDILMEGYADMATYRSLMAYMADDETGRDPGKEVKLDGVGGTALLVKAEVHRDGAMFPPFSFYHLIETEGFAKMAARLGWESWGLPNYFVSCLCLPFQRHEMKLLTRTTGVPLQRMIDCARHSAGVYTGFCESIARRSKRAEKAPPAAFTAVDIF